MTNTEAKKVIRNLAKQDYETGQSERWAVEVDSRKAIDAWRSEAAAAGDLAVCDAIDALRNDDSSPSDDGAAAEYERAVSAICYDAGLPSVNL
jgi:hypothetical protein